ncbi:FAD-binding protein [Petroclostridium sp. X23]|uniref:FAD-binding protein n=1 Tax=Petroclostridium sp. X23 TaxID=3045146 RepID=UPI0024AE0891|nr:FAD-binding protein [Petroclostridium sp. X23]WHH58020.1 FAD-binding protein [Petroclostridium sp. X23]
MGVLSVNNHKCDLCGICVEACPFAAVEINDHRVEFNAACKMCKVCIKRCPKGAIAFIDEHRASISKEDWKGVMVYVEHLEGEIHPVTMELIGKAKQLADKINHPVYCVFIGSNIENEAHKLLYYGIDKVFVYDDEELKFFKVDVYANAFEDCINKVKPSIVLVGGTSIGRSLAPRVSTRFRTGLTADCTGLDVRPNTDLVQVRPAFGGNIMAQIVTPNSRPQFATVRYKVMDQEPRKDKASGTVEVFSLNEAQLESNIRVKKVFHKEKEQSISDAEVLVVAGRGVKSQKDLSMLEELAALLGGQMAVTRPLVEAGWAPYTKQIGLSGRTVKPKLIIMCGVSGAIQFTACMNTSERIVAINKDKNASIFKIAHYGMVGDLYEIVPSLIEKIKGEKVHAV